MRERRAEGRRAGESSAPKSLLMEHAGSRREAAVASCNKPRPWSGRSNLSKDFSMGRSRRDDIRHAARESLGLCHLRNGMAILRGESANRFRFAKRRKTARRRAPSPAKAGGKKAGRDEEDHCSRIRPRVAWQQKSRTLSKRGESMESHPSIAALLGSRVLPRPERQYSGICSKRELRFECPDHEPAKAVVGSR